MLAHLRLNTSEILELLRGDTFKLFRLKTIKL